MKTSRSISYNQEYSPDYNKSERYRFVENIRDGLRWLGPIHEIKRDDVRRIGHRGWYTSEFYDSEEVCYGVVAQLPARDGKPQYVPGWQSKQEIYGSHDDSAVLDFQGVTEDLDRAVRDADTIAKWTAEAEQEYQRKDRLETTIAENREQIRELRKEVKDILKSWRNLRRQEGYHGDLFGNPVVFLTSALEKVFKEAIRGIRQRSHKLWKEIRNMEEEL